MSRARIAAFTVIALALGAAILEAGARLMDPYARPLRGPYRQWDLPRDLGFIPRAKLTFTADQSEANTAGYQGRLRLPERRPGTYRIVLLGDSMASAWLVKQEEAWPTLLEDHLNALVRTAAPPAQDEPATPATLAFEILNFAVPGYNTHLEALLYGHKAAAFAPDHVFVAYFPNDAMNDRAVPNIYRHCPLPAPVLARAVDRLVEASTFFRLAHDFFFYFFFGYPGVQHGHIELMSPANYGMQCSMYWLEHLRDTLAAQKRALTVIQIPFLGDGNFPNSPERVAQERLAMALRERGIRAVSLLFDLGRYPVKTLILPDTHPNAQGHRVIAATLAQRAAALGLPMPTAPAIETPY